MKDFFWLVGVTINDPFYNSVNFKSNKYNPFAPIQEKPSILSNIFGQKDILVIFWDKKRFRKKEYFQLKKDGKLTMNHTLNKILKYGYRKVKNPTQNPQTVRQEIFLPIDSVAFEMDNDKLNFTYKGYKFICTFYPETKINEKHFMVVTGILTGLNKSNKKVLVNYCIMLSGDDLNN